MWSDETLREMGFRQFKTGENLRATFIHLHVFAIEGITVPTAETASTVIKGQRCRFAIAASVNAGCQALLSDDWVPDEAVWQKDKACVGPYFMAAIGPTTEYSADSGHIKAEAEGDIITYDSFPEPKALLRSISADVLPELLTALACQLHRPGHHLRIRPVDSAIVGKTHDGRALHDIYLTMSARGYASLPLDGDAIKVRAASAAALSTRLHVKVSRFFKLALFEEDDLKRFLYFFLALEVQTHLTFGSVDHSTCISSLVPQVSAAGQSVIALLGRHTDNMKSLRDRFVWCALCSWTSITDSDIAEFKRLKKVRDEIAHGSLDAPPSEAVRAVEALAIKVLLQ